MQQEKIALIIQTVLIKNFDITTEQFQWESPIQALDERFKMLSALVELENLLRAQFNKELALVENIITAFHTPKDIVRLVMKFPDSL